MKKLTAVIICIALTSALYSHPVTEIRAKFSPSAKNLALTYLHPVKDGKDHYISEVKIELNGKTVITQTLSLQDNIASGDLMFKIPEAKDGDKITIKTKCNKLGNKDHSITVGSKDQLKKEVPEETKVKEGEPVKDETPIKKDIKAPQIPVKTK